MEKVDTQVVEEVVEATSGNKKVAIAVAIGVTTVAVVAGVKFHQKRKLKKLQDAEPVVGEIPIPTEE